MIYLIELSDKRNVYLLNKLKEHHEAREFDFKDSKTYSVGNPVVIFSPARKLTLEETAMLQPACRVIGGNQSGQTLAMMKNRGITYYNLIENESYAVKNAKLTAEAALALIISSTDKSIYENNVLILGCGRVGKAVSLLLHKIGVKTSVATFDKAEYDACALYADKVFYGYAFSDCLDAYDIIINTIPALILNDGVLEKIKSSTVILELASVNCLDKENIAEYQFKYIPAGGLPMKYSAETAADIMLECVLILNLDSIKSFNLPKD